MPGIHRLLNHLACQKIPSGLLTGNLRRAADIKLSHCGLFEYFSFGGFGDIHTDRGKVARDALGQAQAFLGQPIAPEQMWVVGDTPHDIHCAQTIGARVAAVCTGSFDRSHLEREGADLVLDDLSSVDDLLTHLLAP